MAVGYANASTPAAAAAEATITVTLDQPSAL
jgi:hypothetical protein